MECGYCNSWIHCDIDMHIDDVDPDLDIGYYHTWCWEAIEDEYRHEQYTKHAPDNMG